MKKEGYYSSGEFARMAHVTLRTIRYYDKQNILKPSYVSDAGARFYTDEDLQILQCSLCHIYHDPVIGKGSQNTDQIEYRNLQDRSKQRTEIRTALPDQWHDIQIDQILHKHGSLHICKYTDKDTYHNNYAGR